MNLSPPPATNNRCSLPPWALASQEFQNNPCALEILGIRSSEPALFEALDAIPDASTRGAAFVEYMGIRFQIDSANASGEASTARQGHYLHFLRCWGADSNSRSGAVLKGWVESCFGLPATYHSGILAEDEAARAKYLLDKMKAESLGVTLQLDLVYTYCQYELERRFPGERWLTLYRGTHDPDEYVVRREGANDRSLVSLNNLSSFTSDPEIAWEFGSSVWEVQVPIAKIVFFGGLLPGYFPESEREYLVLGGEYRVKKLRW
jgi:NAD+--dinitrogen-reductase ADP-D-ribosyltransferase